MDIRPPKKAFDPFFFRTAIIRGVRRENGVSRELAVTISCCITGGNPDAMLSTAPSPSDRMIYSLMIRKSDWPDHLPPQEGDCVKVDGFKDLKINSVVVFENIKWVCDCATP